MGKIEAVAGNGLLDRRAFLRGGTALAVAVTGYALTKSAAADTLAAGPNRGGFIVRFPDRI